LLFILHSILLLLLMQVLEIDLWAADYHVPARYIL